MKRIVLALPILLAACATQPAATPAPAGPPPNLAQDAAECGIALALAAITNGGGSIASAALANASCMRLPADILAQVEGNATVQANRALRAMRQFPHAYGIYGPSNAH
jgi:hypothetical protein